MLTGHSEEVLLQCTEETRRRVAGTAFRITLTALISSTLATIIVCRLVFYSYNWALPVFVAWFCIVVSLDRILVTADKVALAALVRLTAVATFAVLHVLLFDIWVFHKDIQTLHQADVQAEFQVGEERLQQQIAKVEGARSENNRKIGELSVAISVAWLQVIEEGNGKGGSRRPGVDIIYGETEEKAKYIVANNREEIKRLEKENERLEQLRHQLEGQQGENREAALLARGEPEKLGMIEQVALLHRLLFEQKRGTVTALSLVFLLFFSLVEALPLLGCLLNKLPDYQAIRQLFLDAYTEEARQKEQREAELRQALMIYDYILREKTAKSKMKLENHRQLLQEIKEMFRQELELLNKIASEKEAQLKITPEEFRKQLDRTIEKALERYQTVIETEDLLHNPISEN